MMTPNGDHLGGLRLCRSTHSDCIIVVAEPHEGPRPVVRQVIEGLQYKKNARRVDITLILELENPDEVEARVRIVHRGAVDGWLEQFTFDAKDSTLQLLTRLYAGRIVRNPRDARKASFYPRLNCLTVADQPVEVSLDGFFADALPKLARDQETLTGKGPSFTSFRLPAIAAKAKGLFVIRLWFEGASYDYLLGQQPWFSVSSYRRLLSDIAAFDMANASPEAQRLFRERIEPVEAHVVPEAYDVVLFQEIGDPVDVMDGSVCILPVRHENDQLAQQVLWFYGKPASEFYLELCYAASRPAGPPKDCFIVSGPRAKHAKYLRTTAI